MASQRSKIGSFFYWMLVFIPLSFYFALFTSNKVMVFITSVLAIIPLARIMGYATKEIAYQSNPSISGLLTATFGNIIELIIAVIALKHGLIRVVQASIIGSIIGNILLLVGLSIFVGGMKYKLQTFNKEPIGVSSTMLIIVVVSLTIPSVYAFVNPPGEHLKSISIAVAAIMALVYIASLVFSLLTHRDIFDSGSRLAAKKIKPAISKKTAILILFLTTVFAAIESEFLVSGIEKTALTLGITQTFIGIVIIAIITNIAEKSIAVEFALQNRLEVSMEIGLSSAIQIALFVVPTLILISSIFGYGFLIVFSLFEVISLFLAVMIVNRLTSDGRCNWLEGAQLISVYLILAIAFFFV